ncbi:hypothetical protein [Bacillus pumilus]|uniref:hypothetical protein n=1 Tax=Bacillus pumilus TaxID=1408 RepID=UPI0015D52E40|nr:hypothetical protein [Bacillus pumilus]QLI78047.1 hypothetical protein HZ310_09610 [Bacillus pumilus]
MIDSTNHKANVNKHKYTRKTIDQDTQNHINDLEETIQEDREIHGKKPLNIKEEVRPVDLAIQFGFVLRKISSLEHGKNNFL